MTNPLIRVQNVFKMYGTHAALNDVSLDLHAGEIVSLLGVNGAGKTTLSSILATLKPLSGGDVLFKGHSIYQDVPAYRRNLGYCPQKPNLNPELTMQQELSAAGSYFGMSPEAISARIDELKINLGIGTFLNARPSMLSGGWKQRYLIARTLMHRPQFVILDEPTVALDPDIRRQLWDYILFIKNEGACVLLTTHYIEEAEYLSDRVCVLDAGQVKLVDTPKNLMSAFAKSKLEDVFIHLTRDASE